MPGLAPSAKGMARTTGINATVEIGRTSTTLTEVDCMKCDIGIKGASQDKTGTMGEGFTDQEMGNITWTIDLKLINHVDSPLDFDDENQLYYVRRTVKGGRILEAYFILDDISDNIDAKGDHEITAKGDSCNRQEGVTWKRPTASTWTA